MYIHIYIYIYIQKFPSGPGVLEAWSVGGLRASGISENTEKSGKSGNSENTGIYRSGAPSGAAPEAEFPGLESPGSFENTLLTGPEPSGTVPEAEFPGLAPS